MCQRLAHSHIGELTSANTPPYFIPVSTALSTDLLISGVYSFNNPSSSWSTRRRDSAYANTVSEPEWAVARRRTVLFAENRNSRDQRYFPMTTTSALLSDMSGLVGR